MDRQNKPPSRKGVSQLNARTEYFSKHHRRHSSSISSTNTSTSSSRTRVLPFALARSLQPISSPTTIHAQGVTIQKIRRSSTISIESTTSADAKVCGRSKANTFDNTLHSPPVVALGEPKSKATTSQFALAQPRRVFTVNGAPLSEALFNQSNSPSADGIPLTKVRGNITKKDRVSIGIRSMKPAKPSSRRVVSTSIANGSMSSISSGSRTIKPIIGLGVTLNPTDTLVTLHSSYKQRPYTQLQSRPIANTSTSSFIGATALAAHNKRLNHKGRARLANTAAATTKTSGSPINGVIESILPSSRSSVSSPFSTIKTASSSGKKSSNSSGIGAGEFTFKSPLLESCISLHDLVASPFDKTPRLVMFNSSGISSNNGSNRNHHKAKSADVVPDTDTQQQQQQQQRQQLPSLESIATTLDSDNADDSYHENMAMQPLGDSKCSLRDDARAPCMATCLLCFEKVLISNKRCHVVQCPSCGNKVLTKESEQQQQQQQLQDTSGGAIVGGGENSSNLELPLTTPTNSAQSSGTYHTEITASLGLETQQGQRIVSHVTNTSIHSSHTLTEPTASTNDGQLGEKSSLSAADKLGDMNQQQQQEVIVASALVDTGPIVGTIEAVSSHNLHSVVKLSAAYDDTFEIVESLQIKLVKNLTETRQRNTLLDSIIHELNEAYSKAQEQMDEQLIKDTERIEDTYRALQKELEQKMTNCQQWREDLDETLKLIQQMIVDYSQHEFVYERANIISLLNEVASSRPNDWSDSLPSVDVLSSQVKPDWRFASLVVPSVLDLGRKRGHVRVISDPFSAHGMVWQIEVRRSRNPMGVPCLSVAANCIDGCESVEANFKTSVHLVKAPAADVTPRNNSSSGGGSRSRRALNGESIERFKQIYDGNWKKSSSHTLVICTLDQLQNSDTLTDSGSVTVRFGVLPESYRSLAAVQEERIKALEQRIKELQQNGDYFNNRDSGDDTLNSVNGGSGTASGASSLRPSRRRKSEGGRGWATSPRANRRSADVSSTGGSQLRGRHIRASNAHALSMSPQPLMPVLPGFTFSSPRMDGVQDQDGQDQFSSSMLLLSPLSSVLQPPQPALPPTDASTKANGASAEKHRSLDSAITQLQQQQQSQYPNSFASPYPPLVSQTQSANSLLYSGIQSTNGSTNGFTLIGGRASASSNDVIADDILNSSAKPEHRRAISLTTKLRRQPPIPFPLSAAHSKSFPPSNGTSGSSSTTAAGGGNNPVSPTEDKAGVLRRLSGWMRNKEGKFAQQAKRVRQLAGNGGSRRGNDNSAEIDDWTFLDKSFSPNFPQSPHRMVAAGVAENGSPLSNRSSNRRQLWPLRSGERSASTSPPPLKSPLRPPSLPLPPIPPLVPSATTSPRTSMSTGFDITSIDEDIEEGFAFDGAADIQRVQEEVDARAERRRQQQHTPNALASRDMEGDEEEGGEEEADSDDDHDDPAKAHLPSASPPSTRASKSASDVSVGALQARYDSILQRVDALQLIANTVENSRDGFTEGTLRRVSSELGLLMDGRRKRLEEARGIVTSPRIKPSSSSARTRAISPDSFSGEFSSTEFGNADNDGDNDSSLAEATRHYALNKSALSIAGVAAGVSRRSVSMDPHEIRKAMMRCDLAADEDDADDGMSLLSFLSSSNGQQPPSPTLSGFLDKSFASMSICSPKQRQQQQQQPKQLAGILKSPVLADQQQEQQPAKPADFCSIPLSKSLSEPAEEVVFGSSNASPILTSSSMPEATFGLLQCSPEHKAAQNGSLMTPTKDGAFSVPNSVRSSRSRRLSINSATSSSSSIGRSPARITRSGGGGRRRDSFGSEITPLTSPSYGRVGLSVLSRNGTPIKAPGSGSLGRSASSLSMASPLTPQAKRKGGILKAGRSKRETPARLHTLTELPSLSDINLHELSAAYEKGEHQQRVADSGHDFDDLFDEPVGLVGKARRSSTLPAALDEPKPQQQPQQQQAESTTPNSSSRNHSANRQPRSARTARKRVRFPEERRLLETIRLIDPRVAQSIEQRAATNMANSAGDGDNSQDESTPPPPVVLSKSSSSKRPSPPPPVFDLNGEAGLASTRVAEDAEDDDGSDFGGSSSGGGGLAARVKLSPRLSAKPLRAEQTFTEEPPKLDLEPAAVPGCQSPSHASDQFDTATSSLFDEGIDRPLSPVAAGVPSYKRPPIPPQLRGGEESRAGGDEMAMSSVRSSSDFDADYEDDDDDLPLGKCCAGGGRVQGRSPATHTDSSQSDLSLPLIKEATLASSSLCMAINKLGSAEHEQQQQRRQHQQTANNRRMLHVGPNVVSAQSSPQAKRQLKSSNESSPSDGDENMFVTGTSMSVQLYASSDAVLRSDEHQRRFAQDRLPNQYLQGADDHMA
ncbi:hypothetical protein GGI12_001502 [Dipsacomyces acuminosporus]|nr:hypothetical protein GGI12_001502 [Dipsacomyces acuminosporus]